MKVAHSSERVGGQENTLYATHSHLQNTLELLQFSLLLLDLWVRLSVLDLTQQRPCYVQDLLQLLGPLQLHVTVFVPSVLLEYLKESDKTIKPSIACSYNIVSDLTTK